MKLRDANLQVYEKKLFHTSFFIYFASIFSECVAITSSKEPFKVYEDILVQEIQAKSSVTWNLPFQLQFI